MTSADRWMLPEGVDELLPERAAIAEQARRSVLDLFKFWGYQLVIPPLIEFTDSLLIGTGQDVEVQSFRLTDQLSGKPMAVRADITPQTARIDAHSLNTQGVRRLCYAGSVLHTRPKTLMASRCPIQVGAELYGDQSIAADIEVVSLMLETLTVLEASFISNGELGLLDQLTIDLGHVAIDQAIKAALAEAMPDLDSDDTTALFAAIQRKSQPDLNLLLADLAIDQDLMMIFQQLPTLCGGVEVLAQAKSLLGALGLQVNAAIDQLTQIAECISARFPKVVLYFDLAEIHGYEYHTGLVFAAYADGNGLALANGGRYDNIGQVFGAARSATGFNADLKALLAFLQSRAGNGLSAQAADIIAAPNTNNAADDASLWQAVSALRQAGEVVIFNGQQGAEPAGRQLVNRDGQWQVEIL
ncbi:MAG: ATP phosphoribosyltransferase regulatory subunit [Actinobacteria bacterium TMED172]|nr:ATP phosphoribosyltransferase regulatory subunit [Cellvibrionales bacterium]OUW32037.1 MAG: ATP phosphoribosyltransferase regulatory subunit [Actinobacteria bacterium TMED172]|tara:strand:- start:22915 stop:24159 length:1245 start_codon:yes stop_codon:yes gene_type:complete